MAQAHPDIDPRLIEMITQAVTERWQAQNASAEIKPPVGLCTAGSDTKQAASIKPASINPASTPAAAPQAATPAQAAPQPANPQPVPFAAPVVLAPPPAAIAAAPEPTPRVYPVLRGFVTAQSLEDAVAEHGTARLAIDARLTPLAADFARTNPARIQRVSDQGAVSAGHQGQWLLWSQAFCPLVQAESSRLHQHLVPASVRRDGAITEVADQTAQGIALGRLAGGVLFVRQRAAALCLLNRYRDIRAAGANCLDELEQAIAEIGVNVLVVELPQVTAKTIAALLDRLLVSNPALPHAYASLLKQGVSR